MKMRCESAQDIGDAERILHGAGTVIEPGFGRPVRSMERKRIWKFRYDYQMRRGDEREDDVKWRRRDKDWVEVPCVPPAKGVPTAQTIGVYEVTLPSDGN